MPVLLAEWHGITLAAWLGMRFAILFLVACGVEPVEQSGTRLVLMHSDTGDWILDTELPGECAFQRESADSYRCVPEGVTASDAFVHATREGTLLVAEDGLVVELRSWELE